MGSPGRDRDGYRGIFEEEPIGDKPATDITGIGVVYGERLANRGYDKAYVILGQFLVLKMVEDLFVDWMKDIADIPKANAKSAYDCLNSWCQKFLL